MRASASTSRNRALRIGNVPSVGPASLSTARAAAAGPSISSGVATASSS